MCFIANNSNLYYSYLSKTSSDVFAQSDDRGYGHLAVTASRDVPFAGAFAVVKRQSELKISAANAGAKLPECT